MALAVGTAAVKDESYLRKCVQTITDNREYTRFALEQIGFYVMESHTSFLFIKHPQLDASAYYTQLKDLGILTRYYSNERIKDFLRVSIGTRDEMQYFINATKKILLRLAC